MRGKLKLLKADLKTWKKEVFCMLDSTIENKKSAIEVLDGIDDALGLEMKEIIERNRITAELIRNLIWKEALLSQ